MSIKQLSQRDPKWASAKLPGGGTIGAIGCTVTCIAMLLGTTPDVVAKNDIFTGNLVVWAKLVGKGSPVSIKSAFRYYTYRNDVALETIRLYGAVLVEVDARVIGGAPSGKHWVLFVGNQKAFDPWDGKVYPTSRYTLTGMAVLGTSQAVSPQPQPQLLPDIVSGNGITLHKLNDIQGEEGKKAVYVKA